jgi:hypothetical protein
MFKEDDEPHILLVQQKMMGLREEAFQGRLLCN